MKDATGNGTFWPDPHTTSGVLYACNEMRFSGSWEAKDNTTILVDDAGQTAEGANGVDWTIQVDRGQVKLTNLVSSFKASCDSMTAEEVVWVNDDNSGPGMVWTRATGAREEELLDDMMELTDAQTFGLLNQKVQKQMMSFFLGGYPPKPVVSDALINVYFDGWNPTPVPRKIVPVGSGFAYELLYRFSTTNTDFTSNSDVLSVPFTVSSNNMSHKPRTVLRGEYIRKIHSKNTTDRGLAMWKWEATKASIFDEVYQNTDADGNQVEFIAGAVEKMHVMEHVGQWYNFSVAMAKEEQIGRSAVENQRATALRKTRSFAVMSFASESKLASQLVNAGMDGLANQKIRAFINDGEDVAARPAINARIDVLTAALDNSVNVTTWRSAQASSGSQNCHHMIKQQGVNLTKTGAEITGMDVQLKTRLESYKGETWFTPISSFAMIAGWSYWTHAANVLTVYYAGSTFLGAEHPSVQPLLGTPAFYVSPADGDLSLGAEAIPTQDGRYQSAFYETQQAQIEEMPTIASPRLMAYALHLLAHAMPADYKYLSNTNNCPKNNGANGGYVSSTYDKLNRQAEDLDFHHMLFGTVNRYEKTIALVHMVEVMGCMSEFLRGSEMNAFELYEAAVLGHFVMEWPGKSRLEMMNGNWQD